jgi:hypothetical protein
MGFMDKAKKLAEQAQTKLDEVQKEFNERQSSASSGGGPAVEYDKHGRPVPAQQGEAPTPPHGDPLTASAPPTPPAPPTAPTPDASAPPAPPAPPVPPVPPTPPAPTADVPQPPPTSPPTDDPNQPPKMTSGDPLAG